LRSGAARICGRLRPIRGRRRRISVLARSAHGQSCRAWFRGRLAPSGPRATALTRSLARLCRLFCGGARPRLRRDPAGGSVPACQHRVALLHLAGQHRPCQLRLELGADQPPQFPCAVRFTRSSCRRTMSRICARSSAWKMMISSMRLMNSGDELWPEAPAKHVHHLALWRRLLRRTARALPLAQVPKAIIRARR
jgi:hypothetical protein